MAIPNNGWRPDAPGYATPSSTTGGHLSCETGFNLEVATYDLATWCSRNENVYPTIEVVRQTTVHNQLSPRLQLIR